MEKLVPLKSETLCLSEANPVLNKTPEKFSSQFILQQNNLYKTTAYFKENLEQISINSIIEVKKFEPGTTFAKNIDKTKADRMKIITALYMNIQAINSDKPSFPSEHLNANPMLYIVLK